MKSVLFFVIILSWHYANTQFITVDTTNIRNKTTRSTCDNSNKSTLVENFFNIIFSEFHDLPPVCVCVQMCSNQPTYCYPNGCFKKTDGIKKSETPVARFSENTKPTFFIEDKTDFVHDFMNKNYVDESKAAFVPVPFKQSNVMPINLRPDLFKDKYKILFKYKKMPKVELKYNLGEQVKNMKEESIKKENMEVSKTRWPRNKIHHHFSGQRLHTDSVTNRGSRSFLSAIPAKDVTNYSSKYFKRELANNINIDTDDLDLNASIIRRKSELENTPFSLEKLLDSLIENNFESNKASNFGIENDFNMMNMTNYDINDTLIEEIGIRTKANETLEQLVSKTLISNITTDIISINDTLENIDQNKYTKINTKLNMENSTNGFSDVIASLSKKIDIQNNTSLEMIRRLDSELNIELTTITNNHINETSTIESTTIITTENTVSPTESDIKTTKKSRQILAKRLLKQQK